MPKYWLLCVLATCGLTRRVSRPRCNSVRLGLTGTRSVVFCLRLFPSFSVSQLTRRGLWTRFYKCRKSGKLSGSNQIPYFPLTYWLHTCGQVFYLFRMAKDAYSSCLSTRVNKYHFLVRINPSQRDGESFSKSWRIKVWQHFDQITLIEMRLETLNTELQHLSKCHCCFCLWRLWLVQLRGIFDYSGTGTCLILVS